MCVILNGSKEQWICEGHISPAGEPVLIFEMECICLLFVSFADITSIELIKPKHPFSLIILI